MNSRAKESFRELNRNSHSEYVFSQHNGEPYKDIGKLFEKVVQDAGLTDVTPHTLRHTFASRLVMAGVDLITVQQLGGWSALSMVQRFSHLSPKHKTRAVEAIVGEFHNGIHNTSNSGEILQLAE